VETIKVSFGAAPKLGVEFRAAATSLEPSYLVKGSSAAGAVLRLAELEAWKLSFR